MFTSSAWVIGATIGVALGLAEALLLYWFVKRGQTAGASPTPLSRVLWPILIASPVAGGLIGAFAADVFAGSMS